MATTTSNPADVAHEYQPGDTSHPMHTDPLCAECGERKDSWVHSDDSIPGVLFIPVGEFETPA